LHKNESMGLNAGFTKYQIHPNTIRQVLFLSLLIVLGYIIFRELYFMLSAFFGAVTLYVILMSSMKKLVIVSKWKPWIAALFLMVVSLIIMVIPLIYMTSVAIDRLMPVIDNPAIITEVFNKLHEYLFTNFGIDILKSENVEKISSQVIPFAQNTLGNTFSAIANIFLMYLIVYFLLVETKTVEKWLRQSVPFKNANVRKSILEIKSLVYSNALGIPIVAFIQGIVAVIGYWIFGVEEFILMGILTAISSVLPIIGTLAVYLPLAIYQFAMVNAWEGIGVGLWGLIVIGSVDNIARFMVQKKLADVHPLITLLGVIMGINLFGFIGVIYGPLMLSVFFMFSRIYVDEFGKADANRPDHIRHLDPPGK
jgi:predicted PurR-regulated permease PerM